MQQLPREAVVKLREGVESDPPILSDSKPDSDRLYVFFSFDLVNATAFKTAHPDDWPLVIKKFYEFIEDQLRTKRLPTVRRWKYVGDEVLFYMRVRCRTDLRHLLLKAHQALGSTIDQLHDRFESTRTLVSLKGCVWCAHVHEMPAGSFRETAREVPRNIVVRSPNDPGYYQLDFLGPDIDIGFRIGQFSAGHRLVVSADLALLMFRDRGNQDGIEKQLRIVAYRQLKGVWGNRHYPIIWYEDDWDAARDRFAYDARFNDPIAQAVLRGDCDELSELPKILRDLEDLTRVDTLWSDLPEIAVDEDLDDEVPANPYLNALEVHCVAVVVRGDGRVLVAQRAVDKRRFPSHWEFGCAQAQEGETFPEALIRAYKSDFDADLDFGPDPLPVRIYDIDGEVPGVIVLARIRNPHDVVARKHQRIDWITGNAEDREHFKQTVPDFWTTIERALLLWRDRREGAQPVTAAS